MAWLVAATESLAHFLRVAPAPEQNNSRGDRSTEVLAALESARSEAELGALAHSLSKRSLGECREDTTTTEGALYVRDDGPLARFKGLITPSDSVIEQGHIPTTHEYEISPDAYSGPLRYGFVSAESRKRIRALVAEIAKQGTVHTEAVLFRGMAHLSNVRLGDTVEDPGFCSKTLNPFVARGFAEDRFGSAHGNKNPVLAIVVYPVATVQLKLNDNSAFAELVGLPGETFQVTDLAVAEFASGPKATFIKTVELTYRGNMYSDAIDRLQQNPSALVRAIMEHVVVNRELTAFEEGPLEAMCARLETAGDVLLLQYPKGGIVVFASARTASALGIDTSCDDMNHFRYLLVSGRAATVVRLRGLGDLARPRPALGRMVGRQTPELTYSGRAVRFAELVPKAVTDRGAAELLYGGQLVTVQTVFERSRFASFVRRA